MGIVRLFTLFLLLQHTFLQRVRCRSPEKEGGGLVAKGDAEALGGVDKAAFGINKVLGAYTEPGGQERVPLAWFVGDNDDWQQRKR